jgi:catechol 2,3-dioxygenase-like lactoylglutathione lyase family enzyme
MRSPWRQSTTRPFASPFTVGRNPGRNPALASLPTVIEGIDHVQLAAPPGCEDAARRFFGELLGLEEIEKPEPLKGRGGVWFRVGTQQLHVGVEPDFSPARKAHPAFSVSGYDELQSRLRAAHTTLTDDDSIPGLRRCYVADPWGNRIELLDA